MIDQNNRKHRYYNNNLKYLAQSDKREIQAMLQASNDINNMTEDHNKSYKRNPILEDARKRIPQEVKDEVQKTIEKLDSYLQACEDCTSELEKFRQALEAIKKCKTTNK